MPTTVPTTLQQESWLRSLASGGRLTSVPCLAAAGARLDEAALARAIGAAVAAHPALRTSFRPETPGEAVVHGPAPAVVAQPISAGPIAAGPILPEPIPPQPIPSAADPQDALRDFLTGPIPLDAPVRLRWSTLDPGDGTTALALAADHLAVDALSVFLLVDDIGRHYAAEAQPVADDGYYAFAARQRDLLGGPLGDVARAYWEERFDRWGPGTPACALAAPEAGRAGGRHHDHRPLAGAPGRALDELAVRHHTSRFVVLAAALLHAQLELTGAESAGIATDFHGRVDPGVWRTVGLFAHGMPIHLDRADGRTLDLAVAAVRDAIAEATSYAMPLRELSRAWSRRSSRTAEYERPHVFLAAPTRYRKRRGSASPARSEISFEPLDLAPFSVASPNRLHVALAGAGDDFHLTAQANTAVFPADRVQALVDAALDAVQATAAP